MVDAGGSPSGPQRIFCAHRIHPLVLNPDQPQPERCLSAQGGGLKMNFAGATKKARRSGPLQPLISESVKRFALGDREVDERHKLAEEVGQFDGINPVAQYRCILQ